MREQQGSLGFALVGAMLGALVGGALYYSIMFYANIQSGYLAALIGIASGYGSLRFGNSPGTLNGILCAVCTLAAIGVSEFMYFENSQAVAMAEFWANVDASMDAWREHGPQRESFDDDAEYEEALADYERFNKLTTAEQDAEIENDKAEIQKAAHTSFIDYLQGDLANVGFTLLFAAIGIYAGFSMGSGSDEPETA